MASCITSTFGNSYSPQIKLTVTESSSTATTITLKWTLAYITHGYAASTTNSKSCSVSINGKSIHSESYNINGITDSNRTIESGSVTINRSDISNNTIPFKCSMNISLTWNGVYRETISASGNLKVDAPSTFTIKFNPNGGSGAPSSQTKTAGKTLTLSSTKPTRTGYNFVGWSTSSSATTATYAAGGSYTDDKSVTLYAVWSKKTYTVKYNANGGSGAPSNQTKRYGEDLKLSSTIPTRKYYKFKGWGTSSSSTSVSYAAGSSYTKNSGITLYAVWELTYKKPTITKLVRRRCLSVSDTAANDDGTYARVGFTWSTYNTATKAEIRWKKATATSYPSANLSTITLSGKSGSNSKVIGGGNLDPDTAYTIKVTIYDSDGSTTGSNYSTTTLPARIFAIDVYGDGKGVRIGKPATGQGFVVDWETTINSKLNTTGSICINNNVTYRALTSSGESIRFIGINEEDNINVGNSSYPMDVYSSGLTIHGSISTTGQIRSGSQVVLPNNTALRGYRADNENQVAICYLSSSDNVVIGDTDGGSALKTNIYAGTTISLYANRDSTNYQSETLHFNREQDGDHRTTLYPNSTGNIYLGKSSYRFNTAYLANEVVASDLKEKDIIDDFDFKVDDFIMNLKPIAYHRIGSGDTGTRIHMGFGAQDVSSVISDLKLGNMSLVQASIVNEDGTESPYYGEEIDDKWLSWGINYTELFAPLVLMVQNQQKTIKDLQEQIKNLQEKSYE